MSNFKKSLDIQFKPKVKPISWQSLEEMTEGFPGRISWEDSLLSLQNSQKITWENSCATFKRLSGWIHEAKCFGMPFGIVGENPKVILKNFMD